jgi:hypothetical protein
LRLDGCIGLIFHRATIGGGLAATPHIELADHTKRPVEWFEGVCFHPGMIRTSLDLAPLACRDYAPQP